MTTYNVASVYILNTSPSLKHIQPCREGGFNDNHASGKLLCWLKLTLKLISPYSSQYHSPKLVKCPTFTVNHGWCWPVSLEAQGFNAPTFKQSTLFTGIEALKWEALTPLRWQRAVCPLHKVKRPSSDTLYPLGSEEECPGFPAAGQEVSQAGSAPLTPLPATHISAQRLVVGWRVSPGRQTLVKRVLRLDQHLPCCVETHFGSTQ